MTAQFESGEAPYDGLPDQEETPMLTHAAMRGMFYRNEISREVLWQLEGMWANKLGAMLPPSALDLARRLAERDGRRFWTWDEEQRLTTAELYALAEQRKAEYQVRLSQQSAQVDDVAEYTR